MKFFIKILLFFVVLVTNVKVVSAIIAFPNIQKKPNSNIFHPQVSKPEFKFSENNLANCCQKEQNLLAYRS